MATIKDLMDFTTQALRDAATLAEAQERIVRQFPDRALWQIQEVMTAALGGDEMDIQPAPGSLREKFWTELAR